MPSILFPAALLSRIVALVFSLSGRICVQPAGTSNRKASNDANSGLAGGVAEAPFDVSPVGLVSNLVRIITTGLPAALGIFALTTPPGTASFRYIVELPPVRLFPPMVPL